MINLEKSECCGCGACAQVCPKQCIDMTCDDEGFLYPVVTKSACIDCQKCEKVCPVINQYKAKTPLRAYAAINNNEKIRFESSSGGIFTLLAEQTINEGGVVFGATFNEDWQVELTYTESIEDLSKFRGSKYVQADTKNTFNEARNFLEEGRNVLYSGTPCQITGLKHFLKKDYANLLTVDVICHGTPSPKVWGLYLEEITQNSLKAIKECSFRNKANGWKRFNFTLKSDTKDDTIQITSYHRDNHYMRAFLSDMILRPSCHNCSAKKGKSNSDITLADFWGIQEILPEIDDDKGIGLVLINTNKGAETIKSCIGECTYHEVSFDKAIMSNPAWYKSLKAHSNRNKFFQKLHRTKNITALIESCLKPDKTIKQQIYETQIRMKVYVWNMLHMGGVNAKLHNDSVAQLLPQTELQSLNINKISFRDKKDGWKLYCLTITYSLNRQKQ